jgi:hypothetical protein
MSAEVGGETDGGGTVADRSDLVKTDVGTKPLEDRG